MKKENQNKDELENIEKQKDIEVLPEENVEETNNIKDICQSESEMLQVEENNKTIEQKDGKLTKKQQFIQFAKFLAFSLSAGFIQLVSFELFYTWTSCLPWWPSYLISIILSVIWNFTFNRKFTFKSASNVPIAMTLVIIYYCAFIPFSVFGGEALESIGWNGTLVTLLMMVINFLTEFVWDKFIVFNDKITNKILNVFKKNNKNK